MNVSFGKNVFKTEKIFLIIHGFFYQDQRIISSLHDEISKLEKILSELRLSADKALQDNDSLKSELNKAKVHMGAAVKLTEAESKCDFLILVIVSVFRCWILFL